MNIPKSIVSLEKHIPDENLKSRMKTITDKCRYLKKAYRKIITLYDEIAEARFGQEMGQIFIKYYKDCFESAKREEKDVLHSSGGKTRPEITIKDFIEEHLALNSDFKRFTRRQILTIIIVLIYWIFPPEMDAFEQYIENLFFANEPRPTICMYNSVCTIKFLTLVRFNESGIHRDICPVIPISARDHSFTEINRF